MFQFKKVNTTSTNRKFTMSFTDKFLNWYHRYFTEITWFLIGNVSVQFVIALQKHDWVECLWLAIVGYVNYAIWRRAR